MGILKKWFCPNSLFMSAKVAFVKFRQQIPIEECNHLRLEYWITLSKYQMTKKQYNSMSVRLYWRNLDKSRCITWDYFHVHWRQNIHKITWFWTWYDFRPFRVFLLTFENEVDNKRLCQMFWFVDLAKKTH